LDRPIDPKLEKLASLNRRALAGMEEKGKGKIFEGPSPAKSKSGGTGKKNREED
jgi:hypothetical protein